MATPEQNAASVLNALYNGTFPAELRTEVIAAYALLAPANAANAEIAVVLLNHLRGRVKDQLKFYRTQQAAAAAVAQVDTDLAPIP